MPWKRSVSTRAPSASSLSTNAPPSIAVMFLLGWKLKTVRSPNPPIRRPRQLDPMASAASSMTRSRYRSAIAYRRSISTGNPAKWVGMIALVREVMARSTASKSRLRLINSTSTKTGVAPILAIILGAAKKVCDGDHFVAGADAAQLQGDFQRGGGGVDTRAGRPPR